MAGKGQIKGFKWSEDSRHRLSMALCGRILTDEQKRKIGEAHRGQKRSEETKRRISEGRAKRKSLLGYLNSPETRKKASLALKGKIPWNKGMTGIYSEETRRRMGEPGTKRKGEKRGQLSKEQRERLSVVNTGKVLTEEHKKSISKGMKGYRPSSEHRRKLSIAHSGDKAYAWKGGITSINKRIHHSVEYKLWREAVYQRDDWVCQKCFKRGGKLHPHHKKSFADYPELRFTIDNGMTLCIPCHAKEHQDVGFFKQTGT